MTASDKQPKEEGTNTPEQEIDKSSLDSVTKNIAIDEVSIDDSAVESIKDTLKETPTKKPNVNIKSKEDTLGIPDITSYIQQRKQKQAEENTSNDTLAAKDGTDLISLPNIYAVVPHKKGDHKLVFMRNDIDESFIIDPKNRTKGSTYEKNGNKVYEVHADFMQHPTLKTNRGEPLTIWVVDSKEDLQSQLQSIQGGAGGGTNFMSPVYSNEDKKKETPKVEKKKETPKKEEPVKESPKKEEVKKETTTPTEDKPFVLPTFEEPKKEEPKKEVKKPEPVIETKKAEPVKKEEVKKKEEPKQPTEWKLPEFKDTDEKPANTATKQENKIEKEAKPFVLPSFDFDKDGNVIAPDKTEKKDEAKKEASKKEPTTPTEDKPFVLPTFEEPKKEEPKKEEPKKEVKKPEPVTETKKVELVKASEPVKKEEPIKKAEQAPKKQEPAPKKEEAKKAETPKEDETPAPFMLDLDDILPKKEVSKEKPAEKKPVVEKAPAPVKTPEPIKEPIKEVEIEPEVKSTSAVDLDTITETVQEAPIMDLDAITENNNTETPQEVPVAAPVADTAATKTEIAHPAPERHTAPKKRSKRGLKIRIAGLVALPLLLLAVLAVMFPSSKSTEAPDETPIPPIEQEPNPIQPVEGPIVDPIKEQPQQNSNYTMNELQAKIEAQQIEARRGLNKAKLLNNRDAIKFGTAALLKASKTLDKIKKKTTTADEVQQDAERVDFYLQQADGALN